MTSQAAQVSRAVTQTPDGRDYPSVIPGRFAGDGIRTPSRGGAMILVPCDWCGKLCNFRRSGPRICTSCWVEHRKKNAKEEVEC